MKVLIFGALGMLGQGVVQECLIDLTVDKVFSIGRTATEIQFPKFSEIVYKNLFHYAGIESKLSGFDACFFCLGTTSLGKSEEEYTKITYDLTMAAANALVRLNPNMTFVYISGAGADSTEKGKVMWARVRGRLENDLLKLPFKAVYIFRPSLVRPLNGIKSKTKIYQLFYGVYKGLLAIVQPMFPNQISTTENIGRAMIKVATDGYEKKILTNADINTLAKKNSAQ